MDLSFPEGQIFANLSFMEGQIGLAELIDALIADFQERDLPQVTPRALSLPGLPGKADVVIGMRRSGKTWFLYQQIQERLASGVERERLLYLNFEDERLLPLAAADLGRIPEAFYRRFPASREQLCWFFFDEIQNVPGWETFIRRLLDTEKVALVLTGSSARLLSREIATSLRGRASRGDGAARELAAWSEGAVAPGAQARPVSGERRLSGGAGNLFGPSGPSPSGIHRRGDLPRRRRAPRSGQPAGAALPGAEPPGKPGRPVQRQQGLQRSQIPGNAGRQGHAVRVPCSSGGQLP